MPRSQSSNAECRRSWAGEIICKLCTDELVGSTGENPHRASFAVSFLSILSFGDPLPGEHAATSVPLLPPALQRELAVALHDAYLSELTPLTFSLHEPRDQLRCLKHLYSKMLQR